MSEDSRHVRNIVLFEGHVRWIMERETPKERLAAWEALAAIAFPKDESKPYKPPELPSDGSQLSPCDRARRDTYNMIGDFFKSRVWEQSGVIFDRGSFAYGMSQVDSAASTANDRVEEVASVVESPSSNLQPFDQKAEETPGYSERYLRIEKGLSVYDRNKIAEWHKKIPNPAALKEWLGRNYFFQNRKLVCSDEFCAYAFNKIALEDNFVSPKTNHAMKDIRNAIHWLAIDFLQKSSEIRRIEQEEHRKDLESEFETKAFAVSQMTNEEIATMERKRRRKAEKEAMEKVLRGEL